MSFELDSLVNSDPKIIELLNKFKTSQKIAVMVMVALQLARLLAVKLVEQELSRRSAQPTEWSGCPECGVRLGSKGRKPRQLDTIIGTINWSRRVGRCPNKCRIGQVAPLDQELGLEPNQKTCQSLKQAACSLSVFVPYETAAILLSILTGVTVSSTSIHNWVQVAGQLAIQKIQQKIDALSEGQLASCASESFEKMLLAIGADGVMVPFRPNGGSPNGKTVWREVKVGIAARLQQTVTSTGKRICRPVYRQVTAVLGTIDELKPRIWITAVACGILQADPKQVVWLSDGGVGFWRLFREVFTGYATPVLDFYHACQNAWKAINPWLDGRTKRARDYFRKVRHLLRAGQADLVLNDIHKALLLDDLPPDVRKKLQNLYNYLSTHRDHIDYARFRELGLPIGSGMVESTCKWLIQQRFKGVGMRWSEDGFNNLLHLRLAWVNGTFDTLFA